MTPRELKDWLELAALVVLWIVAATVQWSRQNNKINGVGSRVKKVEEKCSETAGRMTRMEQDLAEYRRDVLEANSRLGRVEKAVEDVGESVRDGNVVLGAQLHKIEQLINDKDRQTSNRLVRIETVVQVEKKVGPIPTGD